MKLRDLGVLLVSTFMLGAPTVLGLWRTEHAINDEFARYWFDGDRYVLEDLHGTGSSPPGFEPPTELVAAWEECCRHALSEGPSDVAQRWLSRAEKLGWIAKVSRAASLQNGPIADRGVHRFAIIENGGSFDAWYLLGADQLFVTLIEPGLGRVAYRRDAFEGLWTSSVVDFQRFQPEVREPR